MLNSEPRRGYALIFPGALLVFALLIVPIVGLIVFSVTTDRSLSAFTFSHYLRIFALKPSEHGSLPIALKNPIYLYLLGKSVLMSMASTFSVLLLAYPAAYFIAFRVRTHKILLLFIVCLPFMTSYLLRVFSWRLILGYNGVINSFFMSIGLIEQPLDFLVYSNFAVVLTLSHAWAAFAILPIYVSLQKIDHSLIEASADLGDSPFRTFLRVTLPLSMPGVLSAAVLVFIPTVGDYVTPTLVGGTNGTMIGSLVYALFTKANQANLGSAVAITMISATVLMTLLLTGALRRIGR